jgi:small-conductance mechanosensitive channel
MRPFQIGDQIVVGTTEGYVERIEIRATHIRAYDGRLHIVPNAEVFSSRVINNTASPQRTGSVVIHLGYGVDLPRAMLLIGKATRETTGVLETPQNVVVLRELTAQTVELETRFSTDSRRRDYMATMAAVREAVLGALKRKASFFRERPSRRSSWKDRVRQTYLRNFKVVDGGGNPAGERASTRNASRMDSVSGTPRCR